jgi:hypothetical protein
MAEWRRREKSSERAYFGLMLLFDTMMEMNAICCMQLSCFPLSSVGGERTSSGDGVMNCQGFNEMMKTKREPLIELEADRLGSQTRLGIPFNLAKR